jgi:hypothetical protein
MMNAGRKPRTFQPNDIVVVRKQVKSKEGQPVKLTLRTKGPYRVIDQAGTNSYHIQKIPAIQLRTRRPGKVRKEAAMRLTKIPVDTADTRFMNATTELVHNPLEKSLGIFDFGKYAQADPTKEYAFIKVNEMWDEPIDNDTDEEEEDEEPNEQNHKDTDHNDTDDEGLTIPKNDKKTTRQKRKRQDTEQDQRPATRSKTQHQEITRRELKQLHEDIKQSEDKLFIIKKREADQQTEDWHVIQIDWEETNHTRARKLGEYHMKFT